MEELTTDEIATIFSSAGDSVTLINSDANYAAYVSRTSSSFSESDWKAMIQRNTEHLEIIKGIQNLMGTLQFGQLNLLLILMLLLQKGKHFILKL